VQDRAPGSGQGERPALVVLTAVRRRRDMRRIRIARRKVRRDRPWLEVLALDPRDPDVVRAKTGRCGERQLAVKRR
jgi:hypothetical protein